MALAARTSSTRVAAKQARASVPAFRSGVARAAVRFADRAGRWIAPGTQRSSRGGRAARPPWLARAPGGPPIDTGVLLIRSRAPRIGHCASAAQLAPHARAPRSGRRVLCSRAHAQRGSRGRRHDIRSALAVADAAPARSPHVPRRRGAVVVKAAAPLVGGPAPDFTATAGAAPNAAPACVLSLSRQRLPGRAAGARSGRGVARPASPPPPPPPHPTPPQWSTRSLWTSSCRSTRASTWCCSSTPWVRGWRGWGWGLGSPGGRGLGASRLSLGQLAAS
jgi:hypothetical protein